MYKHTHESLLLVWHEDIVGVTDVIYLEKYKLKINIFLHDKIPDFMNHASIENTLNHDI